MFLREKKQPTVSRLLGSRYDFVPGSSFADSSIVPGSSFADSSIVPGSNFADSSCVPGSSFADFSCVPGSSVADSSFVRVPVFRIPVSFRASFSLRPCSFLVWFFVRHRFAFGCVHL
ncbi:hypothetical protein TNCT_607821 [Trichonephila clavata]|uniref:Uncharacterized protein n=1 Tax=Trichonephila clavata TaxID=2740835 RepID=A0A8X6HPU8_TRICU|nr:hypothetical protein TNCT_607821 [Trichonephila clavata]